MQPNADLQLTKREDSVRVIRKANQVKKYFLVGYWYKTNNGSGCGSIKVEADKYPNFQELQSVALRDFKNFGLPEQLIIISIYEFHSKAEYDNFN